MRDCYLIGGFSTSFGRRVDATPKALVAEAYEGVLADAGLPDGAAIEVAYFGSATMHKDGQTNVAGQMCFVPLVHEGRFPERAAVVNVENACATSSSALACAVKDIKSGEADLVLVLGMEKLVDPKTGAGRLDVFAGALDQLEPETWKTYFAKAGEAAGKLFTLGAGHTPFMDTYAMQAAWHMKAHGTTERQIAIAAAKTHNFGADNPRAQYRFRLTVDEVLADRMVSAPLTRSMCAPMGDCAAALLVCSAEFLRGSSARARERAVKVKAIASAGGKYRSLGEPGLSSIAAQRAYARSGVSAADIDLAEVHDATSFSEIYQAEMLGLCAAGRGGPFIEAGNAHLGGAIPINTSGGLVSKGHPIAATGASMIVELMEQLRGEAGPRQVRDARLGLAENGGGSIGFDEAIAVVTILERHDG